MIQKHHYLESIESCKTPITKIEKLSGKDKINEYIGFGLRMVRGINLKKIPEAHRLKFQNNLIQIRKKYTDCFIKNGASLSLSKKGMLYSDYIIPDLLL